MDSHKNRQVNLTHIQINGQVFFFFFFKSNICSNQRNAVLKTEVPFSFFTSQVSKVGLLAIVDAAGLFLMLPRIDEGLGK